MAADLAAWVSRGQELGLFPDDRAMARYYQAWQDGNQLLVIEELERILTGPLPMPGVNWLAMPALMSQLDLLTDGPTRLPEDWDHSDFSAQTYGGELVGPGWLAQGGTVGDRWDVLASDLARSFLFSSPAGKASAVAALANSAVAARSSHGLAFGDLARAAVAARFLGLAAASSPALAAADPTAGLAGASWPVLRDRAEALASAWWSVLGAPAGSPRPLTLAALRSCAELASVDGLLSGVAAPACANAISFLRCLDYPS